MSKLGSLAVFLPSTSEAVAHTDGHQHPGITEAAATDGITDSEQALISNALSATPPAIANLAGNADARASPAPAGERPAQ